MLIETFARLHGVVGGSACAMCNYCGVTYQQIFALGAAGPIGLTEAFHELIEAKINSEYGVGHASHLIQCDGTTVWSI